MEKTNTSFHLYIRVYRIINLHTFIQIFGGSVYDNIIKTKRTSIMKIYAAEDLQRLFKISKKQAYILMRTEGFPSIKLGRNFRVEEGALLDWIKNTKEVKFDYSKY